LWPCHGAVENELLAAEVWREFQILKFERRQDKGVPESSLDWEDPTPQLSEVSTFREASLTKRGDPVQRRQPGQGRRLFECPGARRSGGADPGAAATRTGARGGTKQGEETHPSRSQSVDPERRKGLKPGPGPGPRRPGVGVLAPNVRSMLMGRPNWSQITKQAGFKQALLRARSRARFIIPKKQGQRSHAGEMAAQFLYPG
jgi:hypothetical protein